MIEGTVFVLWLMQNPKTGPAEDIPLQAFMSYSDCETERKEGDFAKNFQCRSSSGREAAAAAELFSKLANCDPQDKRCVKFKNTQDLIQRMRYPHGYLEERLNHWLNSWPSLSD